MTEYNWRAEREKYRISGINKKEDGDAMPAAPFKESSGKGLYIILALILLAAIIAFCFFAFKPESSEQWAKIAESRKSAVGIAVLTVEWKNGQKMTLPLGTAWAFSEKQFGTNGHVANALNLAKQNVVQNAVMLLLAEEAKKHNCESVEAYLKELGARAEEVAAALEKQVIGEIRDLRADIIVNGSKRKNLSVEYVQIHKDYGVAGTSFDPDIAIFTVSENHDNFFPVASQQTLENLKSGMPVAFLGFPSEGLHGDNVNLDNPIASMQSGIVVAVSDFDLKDAGSEGNFLLRHNLPSTGGASGSPIFNSRGEVVALLHAGNVIGHVRNGEVQRAPSAAQVNFGVRVDLMNGMGEPVAIRDFLKW